MLALVAAGRSYSAAAAEVFGDERFRGRVERIVRRERNRPAVPRAPEDVLAALACEAQGAGADGGDSWLEKLLPLYGASLKRRLEADQPVSGREVIAFAQLELRLENRRQVKALNAITRTAG